MLSKILGLLLVSLPVFVLCVTAGPVLAAQDFITLVNFDGAHGSSPNSLIQAADGNFYGTTSYGGYNNSGTVFRMTPAGVLTTIYEFCVQAGCPDGKNPYGPVQGADGNFYGTTESGGANNLGTVFKITPGGVLTTRYSFTSQGGSGSTGLVQATDGNLYGVLDRGLTPNQSGVVFKLDPLGVLTNLYSFCAGTSCPEGSYPNGLVQASDGNFYGTTGGGGTYTDELFCSGGGCGTVFKLTPTGSLTTLYTFCTQSKCPDGARPNSNLIQGNDGALYGTTTNGGANYVGGTAFRITLAGTLTTLYNFDLTLGFSSGLIQANDGNFYGTTTLGGPDAYGTVFRITPRGAATVLHSFDDNDGEGGGGLVQGSDGNFYGTTQSGGIFGIGTAFALVYGYTLSVATSGQGTIATTDGSIDCGSGCSATYKPGNVVTLNATPSQGWTFTGWTGCESAHANTCTVTMSSSRSVSASFSPSQSTYSLTIFLVGTGTGTVISRDGQISCGAYCSGSYSGGTSISLTAVPIHQGSFGGWTGCDSSAGNVCTVSMNSTRTVTASFLGGQAGFGFVPVTPCRVADTRNPTGTFGGPSIAGDTSRDFPVSQSTCGIPSTALAYSLNVTVVPQSTLGYLTVWPAGLTRPVVSTLNSYDGRVKANASIMPAGANGAISVFATDTTDVILDINGYFDSTSNPSALAFYPLTPCRVFDTRNGTGPLAGPFLNADSSRSFPVLSSACGLPSNAQAYSMNFTVVPRGPLGYLTVWPSDQPQPYVSTLNAYSGQNTANAAIVPAASNGDISAFVTNDSDLIADINGYFAPPGHGGQSLYLLPPCRVSDTRTAGGAFNGTLTVPVAGPPCAVPSNAGAFVLNATVVPQGPLGYLTLWPDASSQPVASILNASDGVVTSNMAIMPNLNGLIDAYVNATSNTDLILDILSYFAP